MRNEATRRLVAMALASTLPAIIGMTVINEIPVVYSIHALEWDLLLLWPAGILIGITAFVAIASIAGYHPRHFVKKAHLPAPIAGCIGGGIFIGLHEESFTTGIATLGLCLVAFLMASGIATACRRKPMPGNRPKKFNEAPITTPEEDHYALKNRAQTLAKRIRSGCGPILVMGRYGSGKSSLANLVFDALAEKPPAPLRRTQEAPIEWLKVSVSGWGLQSPESRAKEILGSVCDHIQDQVDTMALREQCRGFLRDIFGDMHWIARISFGLQPRSVREIADQMDHLLKVADKRVLLILDDFERNARVSGGTYDWHCGISELIEHLKHSQRITILACVTKESVR
jgi:hypothetical protein